MRYSKEITILGTKGILYMYCIYSWFVFYQSSSICGWTSAFLLTVHKLCGVTEGRLSHFLPRWLSTGWQSVISQEKIP